MLRLFIMKGGFVCTQIHVRSSLGNRFRAVRRIRFAVRLCPLSALFCTPVCNLTVLNFCCPRCFVFSGWRTAVACSSFIDRLQLVCFVKGNSLFPLTIPSAELNQLDHSRLRRAAVSLLPYTKLSEYFVYHGFCHAFPCQRHQCLCSLV